MDQMTRMALLMALSGLSHALHSAQGRVHNVPVIALLGALEKSVNDAIPTVMSA